jgi:hypothetical protein
MVGIVLAAFCCATTLAFARPPTVMNSPGYDRRLQESRSALSNSPTTTAPANPTVPASKRKKKHPN